MILKREEFVFIIKSIYLFINKDDISTKDNCVVTKICWQNEKYFLSFLYRSPSQDKNDFENFCTNFDILLS